MHKYIIGQIPRRGIYDWHICAFVVLIILLNWSIQVWPTDAPKGNSDGVTHASANHNKHLSKVMWNRYLILCNGGKIWF